MSLTSLDIQSNLTGFDDLRLPDSPLRQLDWRRNWTAGDEIVRRLSICQSTGTELIGVSDHADQHEPSPLIAYP